MTATEARRELADLVDRVWRDGDRIALTHYGKVRAVLVPVEDAEALEALDDAEDAAAARAAMAEPAPTLSFEEAMAELGLDPEVIREAGSALAARRRRRAS